MCFGKGESHEMVFKIINTAASKIKLRQRLTVIWKHYDISIFHMIELHTGMEWSGLIRVCNPFCFHSNERSTPGHFQFSSSHPPSSSSPLSLVSLLLRFIFCLFVLLLLLQILQFYLDIFQPLLLLASFFLDYF